MHFQSRAVRATGLFGKTLWPMTWTTSDTRCNKEIIGKNGEKFVYAISG